MDLDTYINRYNKTHLIFDCDSTILQLNLPWDEWDQGIRVWLESMDQNLYEQYVSSNMTSGDVQNAYIKHHGNHLKERFIEHSIYFETQKLKGVSYYDKIIQYIRTSGHTKYLWTSNTADVVTPLLKQQTIHDRFSSIITHEDVLLLKPEPDGFDLIHDHDTPRSQYLFIGDSYADKHAAGAVGIDFFPITYFRDAFSDNS